MAKQPISNWPDRYKHLSFWWSTVFGVGLFKPAPGTWGSLAAVVLGYALIENGFSLIALLVLTTLITLISIWAINDIEAKSGIHDAGEIVIDEVAGQWIALVPFYFFTGHVATYLLSFALFRLFDIWKPWPIGPIDKHVSGGLGVMIDDIVAGVFAAMVLWFILYFDVLAVF
ncbi:MAG: phosphatidylglycerophosphatase A [Kordiimonas sp.]